MSDYVGADQVAVVVVSQTLDRNLMACFPWQEGSGSQTETKNNNNNNVSFNVLIIRKFCPLHAQGNKIKLYLLHRITETIVCPEPQKYHSQNH